MPDQSQEREFVRIEQHVAYYSGPLPPPEMMRGYEDVQFGSADRILATMEREQKQRARYENLGLLLAFLIAMALIALSAYALALGSVAASIGVIVAGIASTAGTFVYGNRARHRQLRERREAMQKPPPRPELPERDSS
ncbi:MAG: DUF2335 domain-containing protein [Chloroflexota bacterium]|nr:DUF2335 domain-containing protein [Chloroflexota bacterium]MDE2855960.1 DUF2335 domain-containing protein [Chloroflexota bacterium]MDE2945672.1 DUF2335 domain-containing protein [Chloroflexota bacterium]